MNLSKYQRHPFQESLRPLCNLSMGDAMELLDLTKENVDWKQIQKEVKNWLKLADCFISSKIKKNKSSFQLEEFSVENGNNELSFQEWQQLIQASEDIRRDLLEKKSVKKVIGWVARPNSLQIKRTKIYQRLNLRGAQKRQSTDFEALKLWNAQSG